MQNGNGHAAGLQQMVRQQAKITIEFGEGVKPFETTIDFEVSNLSADKQEITEHIVARLMATKPVITRQVNQNDPSKWESLSVLAAHRFLVEYPMIVTSGLIV